MTRFEGQFSPDGRWLAYASNESGRYEIYIRTFPEAGGKWQVSVAGGVQPRWRRDGHELFYVAPDARLMAVPIRLAPDTHTLEAGAPVALFPTRLAAGGNIGASGFPARAQYAVAPDGRFLMNIAADDAVDVADHHRPELDGGAEEVVGSSWVRGEAARADHIVMPLTSGTRLGPYDIVAPSAPAAWARCIARATRS